MPSKSRPGNDRASDPVAITTLVPVSVLTSRAAGDPHRVRVDQLAAPDARPSPCDPTTGPRGPSVTRSTTVRLRTWDCSRSSDGSPTSIPYSDARCTVRSTSAVCRSSLAGMHPRCRHVPPTRRSSTIAMFRPAAAPYNAVAYPAGPPPRTTMSNSSPRAIASWIRLAASIGSTDHRASRIWIAPAARMATPVMAARMSNIRVLMPQSSHATSTHSVPGLCRYPRYALRRSTPSRGQRPRKRTHEHVPARTTHDRGGSQAPGTRGDLRGRARPHHLRDHRVRIPDPRVPRALQDRLRRAERALDPAVHRRARVLPPARAGGGRARSRTVVRTRTAAVPSSARPRGRAPRSPAGWSSSPSCGR